MHFGTRFTMGIAATLLATAVADSQSPAGLSSLTYADLADLAVPAPVAAHVRVRSAAALKGSEAGAVPAGFTRFFVEAEVVSLIRGARGLPALVRYLADLPNDARGKAPKLRKKSEFIVLAAPVAGRPGELRLVAPDAQLAFTPERADRIRAILREASAADAAPRITGIGRAFHVPGSLAGESETQIFLQTADARPVSLTILRRPGETPRWAVALNEVIDEAAAEPRPESLLWYRLACTLPHALPARSLADVEPGHIAAVEADYRLVTTGLGPCARGRARRG